MSDYFPSPSLFLFHSPLSLFLSLSPSPLFLLAAKLVAKTGGNGARWPTLRRRCAAAAGERRGRLSTTNPLLQPFHRLVGVAVRVTDEQEEGAETVSK